MEDRHLEDYGLVLLPDGAKIAASQTEDAKLLGNSDTFGTVVWDASSKEIVEYRNNGLIGALAADSNGRLAAAGFANVEIRDPEGAVQWVLTSATEPTGPTEGGFITDLAFTADDSHLIVLGAEGKVTVWNVDTSTCAPVHELDTAFESATAFSLCPATGTLAICGNNGTVELWDPLAATHQGTIEDLSGNADGLDHADDGSLIVCASAPDGAHQGTLHVVAPDGALTTGPGINSAGPYFVAARPGPRVAVVGLGDNRVLVWDRMADDISELPVVSGSVGKLLWSPDGATLYGASPRNGVIAWSGSGDWISFELP